MPIYAYRCATCGHAQDVLQKISDPVLTVCPSCGNATYQKQVTAAGFQLKGSGWYVTDFRGDKPPSKPAEGGAAAAGGEAKADKKPDSGADAAPAAGDGAAKGGATPAAAPAPAPAPTASAPPPPSPSGKSDS